MKPTSNNTLIYNKLQKPAKIDPNYSFTKINLTQRVINLHSKKMP